MNSELCKWFLQQKPVTPTGISGNIDPLNIIEIVDKAYNGRWVWEIVDESICSVGYTNSSVITTVTVYIPSRVLTGHSFRASSDAGINYLYAIYDAFKTILSGTQHSDNQSDNAHQMTPEEIMESVKQNEFKNQQNNAVSPVPTLPPSDSVSEVGIPVEVPFPFENREQQSNTSPVNELDIPQEKYNGFSQRQVNLINEFKKKFDVKNDNEFISYIHTWNSEYTKKSCLTPENINSFIEWTKTLGELDC